MKEMSVDELCALVQRLGVGFCADVFKKKEVDGAEMIYMSKAGFVCLLVEAGATNFTSGNLFRWQLLSPLYHSGLRESQALKAWARLQPHLELVTQARTRMLVPSQHTSKKVHTCTCIRYTLRLHTYDYNNAHSLQVRCFATRAHSLAHRQDDCHALLLSPCIITH